MSSSSDIQLLLLDVDGVLTDGGLYYFEDHGFALRFHVRDGLGIRRAVDAGLVVGVISGRTSPQVRRRAEELLMEEIHLGVQEKLPILEEILARRSLDASEVCYVGDDVVDIPVLQAVGFAVAVADAHGEVRREADFVTRRAGGYGAVREVIDLILG